MRKIYNYKVMNYNVFCQNFYEKKICVWFMEFFQLVMVIYNEGKGNKKKLKKRKEKKIQ